MLLSNCRVNVTFPEFPSFFLPRERFPLSILHHRTGRHGIKTRAHHKGRIKPLLTTDGSGTLIRLCDTSSNNTCHFCIDMVMVGRGGGSGGRYLYADTKYYPTFNMRLYAQMS